jgi:Raf kinase inhibitor-like YbhB/YbcL family protein
MKTYIRSKLIILIFMLSLVGAGCKPVSTSPAQEGGTPMPIQVTSPAFSEGSTIPKKYTCDAEDLSPALAWSGLPEGTQSLALITHDPDAPVGDWVHWVIYDIPAKLSGFPEGVAKSPTVQGIGTQGINDSSKTGYNGPCPPKGKPHRYFFMLFALDAALNLKPGATHADLEKAMRGHILAQGQLMGKYSR